MSFLEEMATVFDVTKPLTFVVPSEDRNLHRPRESFLESTAPTDINMVQESTGSREVKLAQQVLRASPLGASYRGPIDGIMTPELSSALLLLQSKINERFKKDLPLLSGNKPNITNLTKVLDLLGAKPSAQDQNIVAFEKLFNLPATGKISDKLIELAKSSESEIAKAIGDNSVKGMIWDGKKFVTTPSDVASALKLVREEKSKK